jgi:hypothetical protein
VALFSASKRPQSARMRSQSIRLCMSQRVTFRIFLSFNQSTFGQLFNIWLSVSSSSLAHYQQERSARYSHVTRSTQKTVSWVETKRMSDVSWDELDTLSFDQTKEISVLIHSM